MDAVIGGLVALVLLVLLLVPTTYSATTVRSCKLRSGGGASTLTV